MKALKIIRSIFVWLMVALAVFMMIFTIVSVSTFDRTDRSLSCCIRLVRMPPQPNLPKRVTPIR